jgi:hypothetical protein
MQHRKPSFVQFILVAVQFRGTETGKSNLVQTDKRKRAQVLRVARQRVHKQIKNLTNAAEIRLIQVFFND